jgi:SAM-dependent methyltransferase
MRRWLVSEGRIPQNRLVNQSDEARPAAVDELPCMACGVTGPVAKLQLTELMFSTRERFGYRRCEACGTLRIDGVPADLARHYPAVYFERSRLDPLPDDARRTILVNRTLNRPELFGRGRRLANLVRRVWPSLDAARPPLAFIRKTRLRDFDDPILDVGCGLVPRRLLDLKIAGFTELHGMEPFADVGAAFRGIPIHRTPLEAFPGPGRWALIVFHHSLEHVEDPFAALQASARLLRPGGVCLVRTPVMGTAMWERYGASWVELDVPRHLTVFSKSGLDAMAERAGLRPVVITWEANAWEFVLSEQYVRDLGMYEPGSWWVDPENSAFDQAAVEAFQQEAVRLRTEGRSGRAEFLYERPSDDAR